MSDAAQKERNQRRTMSAQESDMGKTAQGQERHARIVTVTAKCIGCGTTREIHAGEVPDNDMPMCNHCGNPMVATSAKSKSKST